MLLPPNFLEHCSLLYFYHYSEATVERRYFQDARYFEIRRIIVKRFKLHTYPTFGYYVYLYYIDL